MAERLGARMTSNSQRALILRAVAAEVEKLFGPSGTTEKLFRSVRRGPWLPGNTNRPSATLVDVGEQQASGARSDATKKRTLIFQAVLDLDAQFEREGAAEDWSERVAKINAAVQNFDPKQAVLRMEAVRDEPIEVALAAGASEHIWVLEFECDYAWDVGAFGP